MRARLSFAFLVLGAWSTQVACGESGADSGSLNMGTDPIIPPAAPSNLTAEYLGPGIVALAWSDHSDNERGFSVESRRDESSAWTARLVGPDVTWDTLTTLEDTTTYHFRVAAYDRGVNSAYSNIATVTTPRTDRTRWAQISAGDRHTCGVMRSGTAYCWGSNAHGQIGNSNRGWTSRTRVAASGAREIRAGQEHTCVVYSTGAAKCWGANGGRLGTGSISEFQTSPGLVAGGHQWAVVAPASLSTCGLTTSGELYCWWGCVEVDANYGDEPWTFTRCYDAPPPLFAGGEAMPFPWRVPTDLRFTQIDRSCAVTTSQQVYCWGSTFEFQRVPGGHAFSEVVVGAAHRCGLTAEQEAYCWGSNKYGATGHPGEESYAEPVPVDGGHQFVELSAGLTHTCGITTLGELLCWGGNDQGQLGDGTTLPRWAPVRVATDLKFASLSAGTRHTCAVEEGGDAYCWGDNGASQLGNGTYGSDVLVPTLVTTR